MPTASAPFLGAVSGFFAIYGITDFLSNNNKKTLFTSIAMLAVCILTLSRGPLLSFLISITVYHLLVSMYVKNNLNKASLIVPFVFLLVFISISIYSSFQLSEFGRDTASRLIFTAQDILESRHLSLRARALELFIDGSFSQKIFGCGLGSIGEDGLGAYSFSSYLTILVETGLLGAVGVLVVMLSPIKKLYKKTKFHIAYRTMFIQYFSMAVFLLLVNSFYELKTLQLLWVLMSFIYAMGESMPYNIKQLEPLKYSK